MTELTSLDAIFRASTSLSNQSELFIVSLDRSPEVASDSLEVANSMWVQKSGDKDKVKSKL